jgi:hypothetical protein
MATVPERARNAVRFLDDDESHQFFDAQARRLIGMSGDEFIRRYDAGELNEVLDGPRHEAIAELVMLLPFGR